MCDVMFILGIYITLSLIFLGLYSQHLHWWCVDWILTLFQNTRVNWTQALWIFLLFHQQIHSILSLIWHVGKFHEMCAFLFCCIVFYLFVFCFVFFPTVVNLTWRRGGLMLVSFRVCLESVASELSRVINESMKYIKMSVEL